MDPGGPLDAAEESNIIVHDDDVTASMRLYCKHSGVARPLGSRLGLVI